MHTVAVLALESVGGFDLSVLCQILGSAYPVGRSAGSERLYDVRVCGGPEPTTVAMGGSTAFDVVPPYAWCDAVEADTVVMLSPAAYAEIPPAELLDVLRGAHARGARVVSFCNGSFALAAAGLLDGRRAAVHWSHAAEFAARFPEVRADSAVLYVDDGDVLTAAGGAAGIDLCLHLVRKDHGSAVAAETARHTVLPLHRDGDEAQLDRQAHLDEDGAGLEPVLRWMEDRLATELTLTAIAERAAVSVRTLNRRFRARTGTTPLRWLIQRRLQRVQELLETSDQSVEQVAQQAGFGTAIALRQHFRRTIGTTPTAYRQRFRQ